MISPLLHKILDNWLSEAQRPPLLIDGITENDGQQLFEEEIFKLLVKNPVGLPHPDIIFLKRDNKKQSIEVDRVRDFIGQLSLSKFELPFKIGFIPFAHHLNIPSQNALLKTLEEPLKNRYLILGVTAKNKLLPTIISRSTVVNLNRSPAEAVNKSSIENGLKDLYEDCLKSSPAERLQKGKNWSQGETEKITSFFDFIINELHSRLISNLKNEEMASVKNKTQQLRRALNYHEQLQRTSGANPQLLFEAFLLQMK